MSEEKPPSNSFTRFLFGEAASSFTGYDAAIIALLMVYLFSTMVSIAAMNIAYGAAAFLWLGRMLYRRQNEWQRTPFDLLFLGFVVAEGIATVVAYNKPQSLLLMYRRVTLIPIIYVILANVRSERTLRVLVGTVIASAIFVATWSLRDIIVHFAEYLAFGRRLREFQMYMTAGGMMMIASLLLLPFVVHPRTPRKLRWSAMAALVPIGTNLLFTFTRSSWLGFLAGALFVGSFRAKKIVLPVLLVVVGVVTVASPAMQERMSSIFNPYHKNNITRVHMWETGIRMYADHPVFGVGDIGLEQIWPNYSPPLPEPVGHLHNNLMMWLVTLGAFGFLILVSLFIRIWLVVYRIERELRDEWFLGSLALGCLAVLVGFHVNGLFEYNFGDAEIIILVWSLVGMTLVAAKLHRGRLAHG